MATLQQLKAFQRITALLFDATDITIPGPENDDRNYHQSSCYVYINMYSFK